MASLVDQIFAQAQLGTAQDPNANPFATGVQLGQNQQRIDAEKQRLAMEVAQLPLKQTLLQQEAQSRALAIDTALTTRDRQLRGQEAMLTLSKDVEMALSEADPIDALKLYAREGLRNKNLLLDPGYQAMGKQLEALSKEADLAQYRLQQADASMVRAQAAQARADAAVATSELGAAKLTLAQEKEARLREQFDYQVNKFEKTVPADKLAIFRERAKSIQNDLSLIADAAKRDAQLKALADELRMGGGVAPTRTSTVSPFKRTIIKP